MQTYPNSDANKCLRVWKGQEEETMLSGGAEWGVKKSISDEGERGKERKVAPEYYRARVRSETAAAVT